MSTEKTFEGRRETATYATDGKTVQVTRISRRRGEQKHSFDDDGSWAERIAKAEHIMDLKEYDPVLIESRVDNSATDSFTTGMRGN